MHIQHALKCVSPSTVLNLHLLGYLLEQHFLSSTMQLILISIFNVLSAALSTLATFHLDKFPIASNSLLGIALSLAFLGTLHGSEWAVQLLLGLSLNSLLCSGLLSDSVLCSKLLHPLLSFFLTMLICFLISLACIIYSYAFSLLSIRRTIALRLSAKAPLVVQNNLPLHMLPVFAVIRS